MIGRMFHKSLRKRFEDCYTAVPVPDAGARGTKLRYIYYAPWYLWDIPEKALRRRKYELLLSSAAGLGLSLMLMAHRSAIHAIPIVFLAFALMLCCHIYELRGVLQFFAARYRTTKMTYEDVNNILSVAPVLRVIFSCVPVTASVIWFVIFKGERTLLLEALGYALSAALGAWVYLRYHRIPMRTEENDSLKQCDENTDPAGELHCKAAGQDEVML